MFERPLPFLACSLNVSLFEDCLFLRGLAVLVTSMLRQAAPPALEAVCIGRLHAPPARLAVDVGPAVLAWTRATRVTVDITHVSPDPALFTAVVINSGQLERGQRDVSEYPESMM